MTFASIAVGYKLARDNNFPERLYNDEGTVALDPQHITPDEFLNIRRYFAERGNGPNAEIIGNEYPRGIINLLAAHIEMIKNTGKHPYFGNIAGTDIYLDKAPDDVIRAIFIQEMYQAPKLDSTAIRVAVILPNTEWKKDRGTEFLNIVIPEVLKEINLAQGSRRQKLEEYIIDKSGGNAR